MAADRYGTKFDRLFVTVLTPYKKDLTVDERAFRKQLQYFMQPKFKDAGGAIIVNPACGEIFYLTRKEKRRNVEIAMEECGGKVPVFAGVFDLRTEDAVNVAKDAKKAAADGLFIFPPSGDSSVEMSWDPDKYPEVWVNLAKAEIDAVDLPAIAHPTAPTTAAFGKGLPLGATLRMVNEIPNIIGWKMVYNYQGAVTVARAFRALDRHISILAAPADLFHEHLATGYFDGTATGAFVYAMEPMIDHINAWRRKDIDEARRIWHSGLADLHYYVFSNYSRFHEKYKEACWLRGIIPSPFMRPPLPKPRKDEMLALRNLLVKAGCEVIPKKEMDKLMPLFD
jgi:dihydrodipicolinate synthase/N-acetylneuraminate lyase